MRSASWTAQFSLSASRYGATSAVSSAPGEPIGVKEELIRYRPGVDPKPFDGTDWERVERMTDAEIEAAALADPDAQPLTDVELSQAFRPGALRELRDRLGLSQAEFADRFGIDLQILQDWEQARRVPDDIARTYLCVIERNPEAVAAALQAHPHNSGTSVTVE